MLFTKMHYNRSTFPFATTPMPSAVSSVPIVDCPWPDITYCNSSNITQFRDNLVDVDLELYENPDWPLERVVSTVVPVFFGIIGLAGLLGNALVIVGKFSMFLVLLNFFINNFKPK